MGIYDRGVYTYAPSILRAKIYLFTIHYSFKKQIGVLFLGDFSSMV